MNYESLLMILFIALLSLLLYFKRKNLVVQKFIPNILYFVMYKTKLGLKFMDSFSKKFPRLLKFLGYSGVVFGFGFMVLICYELIKSLFKLIFEPQVQAGVGLVLPIQAKGVFYVPFFYWIISIFILATVHEMSHGIIARLYNIKIKSSGFAFLSVILPIIPAAFVEPDEEQLKKAPRGHQLSVFAAGPFSNILLGFTMLALLIFFIAPFTSSLYDYDGVKIDSTIEGLPANLVGIVPGEKIIQIDGIDILTSENLSTVLSYYSPNETIYLTTNQSSYNIILASNPDNGSNAYLGVLISQSTILRESAVEKYTSIGINIMLWFFGLVYWLYLLNIGIGLFNLVPLGPIDGGRMIDLVLRKYLPEKKAIKYFKIISLFFLGIILLNIMFSFIR